MLARNTSLSNLNLESNEIYDAGTRALARSLSMNSSLSFLSLRVSDSVHVPVRFLSGGTG
jgi:hypothetical protein